MLGSSFAPRHLLPNPTADTPGQLTALLGSHLVVTTHTGGTAGRVEAVGVHATRWPYVEVAGVRYYLGDGVQLAASALTYPAGLTRTVPGERGPHPDSGDARNHVERWCPTCGGWQPATPGPQEAGFWTAHAHLADEHVTISTTDGDTGVLHSAAAGRLAARWLACGAGDVCVTLEPCTCTCVERNVP